MYSRLAPLVCFLAATGWCAWPYLSASAPAAPPRAEAASLDAKMLRPKFEPAAERNPFVRPKDPTEPWPPPVPAPKPARDVAAAPPKVESRRPATSPAPTVRAPARATKTPALPEGLSLGGTLVRGQNRSAIINGKVYRQGEILDHEPGARVLWKLDDVRTDGVVLSPKSGGRPAFLAFAVREGDGGAIAAHPDPASLAKPPRGTGSVEENMARDSSVLERLAKISGGDVTQTYKNLWRLALDPSIRQEWLGQAAMNGPGPTGRE